ncbi:hypothetical protein PIB30_075918 [Stylosanthes scabra]|uniref:DUF4283 domain-containing protein n=1 Tax=Stylosanthes scabra TaxID=79078 RepID=A0ABU6ZNU2_9FABA|nr:hypothetical protein [Stylosanthes scabra]
MADRSFSFELIEGAFTAIWNYLDDLRITSLGDNIYQFFFAKETDLLRVERGFPWLFKQYVIHVQRWNKDSELGASDFSIIPMWIQLWDMPESCKTKEAAANIDQKMGCCGFLGHETRNYDLYLSLSATGSEVDLAWRADLKADQVGWRITESKENNNPNWRGRNAAVNSVHKKPTPVSLIRSFAKLSCSAKSGTNNSEEDDSVSSVPIILALQPSENSNQLPFQVGFGHAPEVKRNKRQKLKHMARRRTLGEGLPNVSNVKRAIEEAELQGEFGETGKMVSCNADKGVGANPYMAPQTS